MIRLRNASFTYPKSQHPALTDINMDIRDREFVAIMGRNGSGKSTLARLLNGLLLPSTGSVEVEGMCTGDRSLHQTIRREVALIFSSPDNQLVAGTVEEDVAFGPENFGLSSAEIKNRVDAALKMVSMEDYKKYPPDFLSGGQKQRVSIAGLLAMQPRYMVMDEPAAMVDSLACKDLLQTLDSLNNDKGISIVLITHRLEEALHASRIVIVDQGRIVMDGPTPRIAIQSELLLKYGIEPLEVATIIQTLNGINPGKIDTSIYKSDDLVNAICQ